ncbi:MAG: ParB N-terminal domain-containing protein [Campylobacterota bacterium]|nr:ParB N-terminal domain-containing protein [Campylobacterota bacterium]
MAKLNLDEFKSSANSALERQETQGIFKEHHDVHESVNLSDLVCNVTIRLLKTDIKALKHSIETLGQIEPIIVRKVGEKYEVLNGNRRIAVAKALGFADISADIIEASDEDALILPYLLNSHEGFDVIEIAQYLKALRDTNGMSEKSILEKTGLHVNKYTDIFYDTKGDALKEFNTYFDALLKKHFKIKDGAYNIEMNGISLKIGIDTDTADKLTQAEVYRLIYKLSNL